MTLLRLKRNVVRLLLVAVLAAAALGSAAAPRGRIVLDDNRPAMGIRVDDTVDEPLGEPRDGLTATRSGTQTQSRLGVPGTSAVTTECANGPGSRTRLGLMENSDVQSHCDGITGSG